LMETPRNQDRARLCLNSRASVDKLGYGNLGVYVLQVSLPLMIEYLLFRFRV
jgi:hypothetical protein